MKRQHFLTRAVVAAANAIRDAFSLKQPDYRSFDHPAAEVLGGSKSHGYIWPAYYRQNNGFKRNRRRELKRTARRKARS